MKKPYRKAAPKRANRRTYRDHGGVAPLAAQISGRSISTVYKVLQGRAKSAPVQQAIAKAKRQIQLAEERAA